MTKRMRMKTDWKNLISLKKKTEKDDLKKKKEGKKTTYWNKELNRIRNTEQEKTYKLIN